jgi:hypothetical protein
MKVEVNEIPIYDYIQEKKAEQDKKQARNNDDMDLDNMIGSDKLGDDRDQLVIEGKL